MSYNKTIKLFVSSTFLDFQKERDALQDIVFPKLKTFCQSIGFQFLPVDLRWGVTEEIVKHNQSLNFCINEVKRCVSDPQPSLLILLGQRYGWIPVPSELPIPVWDTIYRQTSDYDREILERCYTLDCNNINPVYYLNKKLEGQDWNEIEKRLNVIFSKLRCAKDPISDEFFYSVTEHEIRNGLDSNKISSTVFNRDFLPEDEHAEFISTSADDIKSLSRLKNYLFSRDNTKVVQKNIALKAYEGKNEFSSLDSTGDEDYSDYINFFCKNIYDSLVFQISEEIKKTSSKNKFEIELIEQESIFQSNLYGLAGRESVLDSIVRFTEEERYLSFYLLFGPSGIGKSCVIAEALKIIKEKEQITVIYRFVGRTQLSNTVGNVLISIYDELINKFSDKFNPGRESDLVSNVIDALRQCSVDNKIVIVLDGVDHFQKYSEDFSRLIGNIPSNVKYIFSVGYDSGRQRQNDFYNALSHAQDDFRILLTPLTLHENSTIVKGLLRKKGRSLTFSQFNIVQNAIYEKSPLFSSLVSKTVCFWKSDREYSESDLGKTEFYLVEMFFDNLVKEKYHNNLLVEYVFGLLSASKLGLSQLEIIDILSSQKELLSCYGNTTTSVTKLTRIPDAFFSRLYDDISDFFTENFIDNENLIFANHPVISEVIKNKYYAPRKDELHNLLASYFSQSSNVHRKARELAWSLHCLHNRKELIAALKDNSIFELIFELYGGPEEAILYFNRIKENYPECQFELASYFADNFDRDIIDECEVQFFENLSLIGNFSGNGVPFDKIAKSGVPFKSEILELNFKYLYLQMTCIAEGFSDHVSVIQEIDNLLLKIDEESELYCKLFKLKVSLVKDIGDHSRAIELCDRWLSSNRNESVWRADIVKLLASYYKQVHQFDKSLCCYEYSIEFYSKTIGSNNMEVDIIRGNMAAVYANMGKHDLAIDLLNEAIESLSSKLGPNERRLASFYNSLANSHMFVLRLNFAEEYYKESVRIAKFWSNLQELLAYYVGLFQCLQAQKKQLESFILSFEIYCEAFCNSVIYSKFVKELGL